VRAALANKAVAAEKEKGRDAECVAALLCAGMTDQLAVAGFASLRLAISAAAAPPNRKSIGGAGTSVPPPPP
jgi:hypothetical protein